MSIALKTWPSPGMGGKAMSSRRFLILVTLLAVLIGGCQPERTGGPLQAGKIAPDFAAKDLDGNVIVLSSLRGRPVIVRFWETDCRYCRADTPIFSAWFTKYQDRGLAVIYVSSFYEKIDKVKEFIATQGVPFPVVMDQGGRLADLYQVKLYPQTFVISPEGLVVANLFGGVGEAELRELIGAYFR